MGHDLAVEDLSHRGLAARIISRRDEGPIRTAAHVSQKRAVGRYASQKNGRGQFWESRNELYGFYLAEVSTDVVAYRAQPHTLELVVGGKKRSYTPDRLDRLTANRVEIVEIKDNYKPSRDPDYHEKLEIARLIYARLGWSFRVTNRDEIEAQPRFEASKYIQNLRRTVITPNDEDMVLERLGSGAVPLADVRALWPSPVVGFAKMCALMIKRTINIRLEHGLSDETSVHLILD